MAHGDERMLSIEIGANVRAADQYGMLTDANVAAANTNAGLTAAIDTVVGTSHGDAYPPAQRIKRAIETGKPSAFGLTDAAINGLTTVEGLADLTENTSATDNITSHFLA